MSILKSVLAISLTCFLGVQITACSDASAINAISDKMPINYKLNPNINQDCATEVMDDALAWKYGAKSRRRAKRRAKTTINEQCMISKNEQPSGKF